MEPQIFVVKNKQNIEENTFEYLLQFVDEDKKNRILSKRNKQDANNSLIGNILVKYAIKKVFGIDIKEQEFCYTEKGKPYLKNYPDIYFNISHSSEYVACVVWNKPIGIDIQEIKYYPYMMMRRVCSEEEIFEIENSENFISEFIKIWTIKEAVLKRKGTGILNNIRNCLSEEDLENSKSYKLKHYWLSISM